MNDVRPKKYVFGEFRLDAGQRILSENGTTLHLPKRPFDILVFLIENHERLVSRDELLDKFWDGREVYDDGLRKAVGAIRRALGDTQKPPRYIETRYGSGFRFIGKFQNLDSSEARAELKAYSNEHDERASFKEKNTSSNSRKVLVTIFVAGALFFASLGFYASLPKSPVRRNFAEKNDAVRSIAILPLKNLTGDSANDYFSDGMTENLITELSRVEELKIASRSSTFALKDKESDPREIGQKLSVDAFLEGSVQKKGETFSISVRLISASDGNVLWTSRNFERPFEDAYELQDTIACSVASELRARFCDGVAGKHNTTNAEAYQAYLKGRYYWNKRTGEGIKRSIEFYEQAIGADADYALAYAGLAESYIQGIWHVPFPAKEALPKARIAALKAIELDESLAEAHTALGNVYELEWKWADAEREIARAVELNPRNARAHHVQAFCFLVMGRREEAIAAIERARELDPLNLVINTDKAQIYFTANRDAEAFQQWKKTLELDPNFSMAREHLASALEVTGNEAAAIEEYAKAMRLRGETAEKIDDFHRTTSKFGLKEVYRQEIKKALLNEKRGEPTSPVYMAIFYTLTGRKDEAFKYLEKACDERSAEIVLVLTSRQFDSLHTDSRFEDLLQRINLAQ